MYFLLLTWAVLFYNNPFMIALLFSQFLLIMTFYLSFSSKFISFILFLVYVGGLMILTSYCVMLIPSSKYLKTGAAMSLPFTLLAAPMLTWSCFNTGLSFGLLYSASAICLVALLLYLVMLSIVDIIGYSGGMMKL